MLKLKRGGILKKYNIAYKVFFILLFIIYFFPITGYFFNQVNLLNILFIIYPIAFFMCSAIASKDTGNFYVIPIVCSLLYIPLTFTIFEVKYLSCFFLYLVMGLLGGLLGLWCYSNKDVKKIFKQAVGIASIIASIFTFLAITIKFYYEECDLYICTLTSFIRFEFIEAFVIIVLMIALAVHCLRKEPKKKRGKKSKEEK